MCYSAMAESDLRKLARMTGAQIDYDEFGVLYEERLKDRSIKTTKALDANFLAGGSPAEDRIRKAIEQHLAAQRTACEAEYFKQKTRLNGAQRALATRPTKKAAEDRRIASDKVVKLEAQLRDLNAPAELKPAHSRIFPMVYAPVIVMENGRLLIRPMRYHCRPNGAPESLDRKFDGLYNARRDTINKPKSLWTPLFGRRHGILVATSFYENVALHDFERRALRPGEKPANVVLHFNPRQDEPMLVACLWDRWQSPGRPDLLSFAAITDEPPEEVAATGHDRCIVPLKPENVARWLDPASSTTAQLDALLADRQRPYYEHRLAA
jgi:putative SOS response-associated peptidase YedK